MQFLFFVVQRLSLTLKIPFLPIIWARVNEIARNFLTHPSEPFRKSVQNFRALALLEVLFLNILRRRRRRRRITTAIALSKLKFGGLKMNENWRVIYSSMFLHSTRTSTSTILEKTSTVNSGLVYAKRLEGKVVFFQDCAI